MDKINHQILCILLDYGYVIIEERLFSSAWEIRTRNLALIINNLDVLYEVGTTDSDINWKNFRPQLVN